MAEQDTSQAEELEARLAEAQAGERALSPRMLADSSMGLNWAFLVLQLNLHSLAIGRKRLQCPRRCQCDHEEVSTQCHE